MPHASPYGAGASVYYYYYYPVPLPGAVRFLKSDCGILTAHRISVYRPASQLVMLHFFTKFDFVHRLLQSRIYRKPFI